MMERTERILTRIAEIRAMQAEMETRIAALMPVIESVAGMNALAWASLQRVLPEAWTQALQSFREEAGDV